MKFILGCTLLLTALVSSHAGGHDESCSVSHSAATGAAPAQVADLNPNAWSNALVSTAIVSIFGNVGIVMYMFIDTRSHNHNNAVLNIMVAFAVGGLLGDVFLHLLPHSGSNTGLYVLLGIFSFFLFERIVRSYHHGTHSHSHGATRKIKKGMEVKDEGIRAGAWLNLFADVQHNFVDGMAIAAAFRTSNVLGMSTMLGVLIHEIPHEMGDFAVLLNQGFSKKGALLCQFISSLGAFTGCLFGLVVGGSHNNQVMLSFTAGGFIYVALVDVLPELMQTQASLKQTVLEFLAIGTGIGIMVFVGTFEDHSGHGH